jgi:RNA polymerase sigma-70 factor (ECF subfamily)
MQHMPDKDYALVQQFRMPASRKKSFEAIVARHNRMLFQYIFRMLQNREDAEDILQLVWIKAWKNLDNFRGDCLLSTWLITIATREVYSKFRGKKRIQTQKLEDGHAMLSDTSDTILPADVILEKLQTAVAELPEKQQQVFIMRYFEELSYEDMSAITGTSVGALKASFHHAVKKIEQYIRQY